MARYEFRLLNDEGKVSAVKHQECASDDEAVQAGFKMMSGYRWVEIWLGPRTIARFACH